MHQLLPLSTCMHLFDWMTLAPSAPRDTRHSYVLQALSCVFRSIPAFNNDLREVQNRMEDVAFKLRIPQRKPWDAMAKNVARSQALVAQRDKVNV